MARIGIDCDGVLRDFIPALIDSIKETHPEHADKILVPESWDWEQWLPFWTEEETEKYVFEDNYLDFFGPECPPIKESVEDWKKLMIMMIQKWNGKDFTNLDELSGMADDIIEVISEVGNEGEIK